jgi:hypothetical protein
MQVIFSFDEYAKAHEQIRLVMEAAINRLPDDLRYLYRLENAVPNDSAFKYGYETSGAMRTLLPCLTTTHKEFSLDQVASVSEQD